MAQRARACGAARARNFAGLLDHARASRRRLLRRSRSRTAQEQAPLVVQRDFVRAEMVKLGQAARQVLAAAHHAAAAARRRRPTRSRWRRIRTPRPRPRRRRGPRTRRSRRTCKNALDRARKLERAGRARGAGRGLADRLEAGNVEHGDRRPVPGAGQGPAAAELQLAGGHDARPDARRRRRSAFASRADGTLSDVKLTKSSGNSFVDDACVDAAKLTRKVPPPPPSDHGMSVECEK